MQSGQFLGKNLVALLKTGLPLMKSVLKPLVKSLLELIAAASRNRCSYS